MSAVDVGLVVVVALLSTVVVALVRAQAATNRRLDTVERRLLRAQRQSAAIENHPGPEPAAGPAEDTMTDPSNGPTNGPSDLDDLVDDVVDLRGVTVQGEPAQVDLVGVPRPTLVAFLSTTCGICRSLWTTLADEGIDSVDSVVVTKDPAVEDRDVARELAGRGTTRVVMSSEAWDDYEVPGSPYFLLVEGDRVVAEGEASSWEGVRALARSHA